MILQAPEMDANAKGPVVAPEMKKCKQAQPDSKKQTEDAVEPVEGPTAHSLWARL